MNYQQVVALWNARKDKTQNWDALCEQEKVDFALLCAFRKADKIISDHKKRVGNDKDRLELSHIDIAVMAWTPPA